MLLLSLLFEAHGDAVQPILAWAKRGHCAALLQRLAPAPADQAALWAWVAARLNELEAWVEGAAGKAPTPAAKLLLLLYNSDVLDEEVVLGWDDERFSGTGVKVRKAVAPVVAWLRTADSGSDEED